MDGKPTFQGHQTRTAGRSRRKPSFFLFLFLFLFQSTYLQSIFHYMWSVRGAYLLRKLSLFNSNSSLQQSLLGLQACLIMHRPDQSRPEQTRPEQASPPAKTRNEGNPKGGGGCCGCGLRLWLRDTV
ncbi:hypothetical protein DFP73DRAFT_548874, partial [Morchella snyderi]